MKYPSVFHLAEKVFREAKATCVLIGGFAVNSYKVTRQTADVDFLITPEDFKKIRERFAQEGYRPQFEHDTFVRLRGHEFNILDIDFMFVDKDTLMEIEQNGMEIKIAGKTFRVPSVEHLIALKLHSIKNNPQGRQFKDFPDIINLIRVNKVKYKEKKFRDLCLKYGTENLYSKIIESV